MPPGMRSEAGPRRGGGASRRQERRRRRRRHGQGGTPQKLPHLHCRQLLQNKLQRGLQRGRQGKGRNGMMARQALVCIKVPGYRGIGDAHAELVMGGWPRVGPRQGPFSGQCRAEEMRAQAAGGCARLACGSRPRAAERERSRAAFTTSAVASRRDGASSGASGDCTGGAGRGRSLAGWEVQARAAAWQTPARRGAGFVGAAQPCCSAAPSAACGRNGATAAARRRGRPRRWRVAPHARRQAGTPRHLFGLLVRNQGHHIAQQGVMLGRGAAQRGQRALRARQSAADVAAPAGGKETGVLADSVVSGPNQTPSLPSVLPHL